MNIKMPNDPPNTTNMPMAVSEKAISEYLEARNLPATTQGNILSAVKEAIIKIATSGHADWDTIIDNNTILSCSPRMFKEAKKNLGWSYVRLPAEIRKAMKLVRDKIDIDDLGEDGKEGHPHITAKYGLTVKNPEEVKNATIGNRGGKVRMGKTSLFENEDCDVLKVSVTSHALHALWKSLSELPNEDKHDEYIPHATLAYLKKGTGKKYRNLDDLDGMEFVFDAFVFQDADDVETEIVLDGKTSEASVDRIQVRTAQFDKEEDLSWMGEVQQEQERKSTLLQDKSPINNAMVGVDEDATFWIDSRSIRRIWPVRTSVSSVNKKILTSQFLDDENDFEIAIHELEPPVQPSSDATTADNTTPDRSESDGAIAIDGENFYPPFSPQFQDSDGEWLDISSMTFQNPLEALWDANAYAASTNTRVRVVDSRGGEFVPSLEHSFSSEYINVNNHPDITGEHEYTLRNNRTSVWSNLVYQTYDEAQISKQRMGGDWRIVPCKHQIEARVRLSPTAPYQEWEDAGFEDDNGNTFLFSHLSEALSAIQDFRANHHGANLVDFRVIPIPLNHIVTNAKTKSSIKKAQFEDEDDFEIAIHELEPFSYSSPKKDAQPRMPSGSYKRGTEIFELLKNTGGTDWEPIGSSDNLQDAAMVVNSAVSRGDSFFDYGVNSSFVGPVPLFMIQKKNGNNEMEGTDNPIVFATRPKAEQALDELYGDGYHIISTYADDPRNNTSRFLVKQLTPQGWVSAWSIASSYASFNDAWKDIQECMFHRPANMFMVIDAEYDCPVRINPPQQINIYWQNSKGSWELAHRYSDMQEARERFTALRNNNPSSHYSVEIIPSETQSREASQQGLRKQAQFEDDDDFEIAVHELDPPSRSNPYFNSVQPLTDIPQEPIEPNGPYRIEKVVEDGQFGETTNRHPVNELLNKQFPSLEKAKAALWSILSCPSQNPADFNILKRNNAIVPSSEWWNEIVSPLQYAIQIRPPNEHNWKFLEGQGYLPSPTYELAKIAVDRMINNGIITNHPENVRIVPIHSLGQTRSTDLVPENEATWTYTVEPLGPYSNAPAGSVRVVFKRNNESIANTIGERPDKALNAVLKRLNIGLPITGRGSNRTRIMAPYELEILRQNNKFSDASTRYYTNYNMSSREGEVWRKSKRSFSNPDDAILDSVATMANRIGTWTSDARQIRVTQGDNNEIDLSNSFVVVNHIPSTPEEAVYTPSNVPREDMQPLRKVFHDWKEAVDAAIRWSTENNISIHAFSIADVDRQKIYPLGWLAKVRRESLASDSVQAMSINKTIKQAQFDNDDSFNISFLQEAEQEFQERTMLFNREKFQIQCRTDHGWITPEDGIKNLFFNEQDARKAVPQFVQQMFPQGRTSSNIDKFRIFGSRQGVIPLTLFKVTFSTKNINQTPVTLNLGNFLTKEKAQQAIEDHKSRFKRLPDTYKIVEGTTSDNWPVVDGSDGEPEKFFVQYSKKQEVYKFVEQDGKPQEFPSKEQAFEKQFELLKTNNPPYATRIISSLTGLVDNRDASTNQTDRIEFTGPYILESWYDANITPGNRWVASRERYEEPDQAWGAAANIVRSTNARATGFRVKDSRNNLLPRPPFFGEQDPPNVANPWVVQYKTPDAPSSAAWNTLQECSTQEEARNVMTSRSRLDSYMVFRLVNTDGPVPRVIDQTTSSVSGHYFPKVLDALSNGFVLLEGDENRTYHTEEAAWAGAKQWMRNRGLNPDATSIMVIGPGGSTHIIPPEHWNDNNETNEPRPTRLTPANLEQQGRRIFDRFENSAFGRQTMIDAASINDEAKLTFLTLNFARWYRRERQEDEPFDYRIMPYIRSILRTIVASQSSTQSNN